MRTINQPPIPEPHTEPQSIADQRLLAAPMTAFDLVLGLACVLGAVAACVRAFGGGGS